ncbi:MAG: type II toxin-antitoxin system death-on-curing family toxin [Clostridia bacterium]|nr:type II toxin-antitoxin system death-on-curing family toxin [Clostridia bacterium]
MIVLSNEQVLHLHRLLTDLTGGEPNLRDEGLLDSALCSAFQSFGGVELYPTVCEKGARLGFSLISNHAFVDGNKRIGLLVMLVFLELNGIKLSLANEEIIDTVLGVASGRLGYEELLSFVKCHIS